MEICMGCHKPIEIGQPSYYKKNPKDDIGESYHATCGDPLGIVAAVSAERERCAKIAEAHKGSAARKRKTEGRQLHMGSEDYAEIVSEERGEDIASEMIAAAIRADR